MQQWLNWIMPTICGGTLAAAVVLIKLWAKVSLIEDRQESFNKRHQEHEDDDKRHFERIEKELSNQNVSLATIEAYSKFSKEALDRLTNRERA